MFTVGQRDRIRQRLLQLARDDPGVSAAAVTGSYVAGASDQWSDIDLALGFRGELQSSLARWTEILHGEFGALHHWDLPFASTVYRVFLLPDCLEVDIAFTPEADFGSRGPNWRTVFGKPREFGQSQAPQQDELAGYAWHHILHARACIERGKPWQAEYLISGARDQVLALACLRLGYTTRFAKGADLLPADLTSKLEPTLVRSLSDAELRRALGAVAEAFRTELDRADPTLSARLRPMLEEIAPPVRSTAKA